MMQINLKLKFVVFGRSTGVLVAKITLHKMSVQISGFSNAEKRQIGTKIDVFSNLVLKFVPFSS